LVLSIMFCTIVMVPHLHAAARLRGEQGAEEKVKTQRFAKSPN